MYAPAPDFDGTSLLQGDIVAGVQILGALNYPSIAHTIPFTGGDPTGWSVAAKPVMGDAMVLSHSCEVALENGIKVTSIILAPLRDISGATPADKIGELISSNRIDKSDGKASYLKYFYLEPHDKIPFKAGAIVDLSKCFSVRKSSYEFLLKRKTLQLTDEVRQSMSLKLALYFHREGTASAA